MFKNMSNSSPKRFQCDFTWTIKNFEKGYGGYLIDNKNYIARSSRYSASEDTIEWYLELRTENIQRNHHRNMKLILEYLEMKKHDPIMGKFNYSFTNSEGETVNKDPIFFCLYYMNEPYVCIENFPQCVCRLRKMKCVHEDQLKIHCRVSYAHVADVNYCLFDQPGHFIENFEVYLNNEELSDITIYVGDSKFPCHKIVLAARSSVFKAMFTHDMKENSSNRVDIRDIDENIFQQVLRYIYTGKVDVLEATAFELLRVADIYDLADLKTLCEKKLGAMLTVENAVTIVSASNTYNLENLNARAMEFIETNLKDIIDTDAWSDLISQPDVIKILLKKFVK